METQELENMMIGAMAKIQLDLVEEFAQPANVNYTLMDDWFENALTVSVKQRIFGKQILHEEITYPTNWKEAFKDRWFPEWAKARWPVLHTTKTFDVREVVPTLDIPGHPSLIVVAVSNPTSPTW